MRAIRTAFVAVAVALLTVGCGQQTVASLEVGDCFDIADLADEVTSVPSVDCAEPHGAEVYGVFDLALEDYDADTVATAADDACGAAFEPYVGVDYADSRYYYQALFPLEAGWTDGERRVVCFVVPKEGTLEGSVKGAGD